jgi:hypothetical protein
LGIFIWVKKLFTRYLSYVLVGVRFAAKLFLTVICNSALSYYLDMASQKELGQAHANVEVLELSSPEFSALPFD